MIVQVCRKMGMWDSLCRHDTVIYRSIAGQRKLSKRYWAKTKQTTIERQLLGKNLYLEQCRRSERCLIVFRAQKLRMEKTYLDSSSIWIHFEIMKVKFGTSLLEKVMNIEELVDNCCGWCRREFRKLRKGRVHRRKPLPDDWWRQNRLRRTRACCSEL
jgi:hypothetical protein